MAQSNSKRKKRSDKFPLTLHPTGQYCKKIRGKLYYFGSDKKKALERYLDQATDLHAGRLPRPRYTSDILTVKTLCNLYLEHQVTRTETGEIKPSRLYGLASQLREFAKSVGPNRIVSDIATIDLQNYRTRLIKSGSAHSTINSRIATVKALYHWAMENEIIDNTPNLKALKRIKLHRQEKPTFTASQIHALLEHAGTQMKAMIWLGLNCGFGCTDCAELLWKHLDLEKARVSFPRTKTGTRRNLPLWKETLDSLRAVPKISKRVFNTRHGNKWVRFRWSRTKDGIPKVIHNDGISETFSKLLKKAGIKTEKGVGFYTLRRTAATLAARSGDPFAVQRLLGHVDLKMAATYVQDVSEQTDRVINNTRKLIIQDDS